MVDVLVVGARVAGAPTAMLLARLGYSVLLVDRDRFPSDTMSTHYIHQPGVAALQRWGLLDRVIATGAEPIRRMTIERGGVVLSGMARLGAIDFTLCPRRYALDEVLVRAAVEAGAGLREDFVVDGLIWEDGAVAGIRGHRKGGPVMEERARLVVGADGVRSAVARAVRAEEYNVRPSMGCGYYAYWRGVPMDGAEVRWLGDCIVFAFPTNHGETCIVVEWPAARFTEVRRDIEGSVRRAVERVPDLAGRVARGERVSRFIGAADLPNFFRRPYGPGWALVGDAGYHKDPVTGLGITDAFLSAELLAGALDAGFSGQEPLEEALAGYERRRNERALPLYETAIQAVSFRPVAPEQRALLEALRGNQEDTDRFLGLSSGVTSPAEFFAPENLARIMAAARSRAAAA